MSQVALSGPPLALFLIATISIGCFALLVGIVLGLLGAVAFTLTVVGFGLIFLFPTLLITIGFATFIWLWGWATYYILKHFNEKEIPGIHKPLGDGVAEQAGVKDQVDMLTGKQEVPEFPPKGEGEGAGGGEGEGEGGGEKRKEHAQQAQGKHHNDNERHSKKEQNGSAHSANGGPTKKVTDAGKGVTDAGKGVTGKAQGAAGGVQGVAGGVKGAVPAAG